MLKQLLVDLVRKRKVMRYCLNMYYNRMSFLIKS